MKFIRTLVAYLTMAWVGIYTLVVLAILFTKLAFARTDEARERVGQETRIRWSRLAMRTLGVRVTIHGTLPTSGTLMVANHITYVDPPLLLAATPCTMLAKYEVSKYPLVGPGAVGAGILFVKREQHDSRLAAQKAIAEGLAEGRVLCLFPEGTTSPDGVVQDFRPGSFRAAASVMAPVVPIAITYEEDNLAWLGTEHLVPHLIRNHTLRKTHAHVWVGPTLRSDDAEKLRKESENWVRETVKKHKTPKEPVKQR